MRFRQFLDLGQSVSLGDTDETSEPPNRMFLGRIQSFIPTLP